MIFAREEKQQHYHPFILHRLCDFKKYKQVFFQTMEIRDDFSIVDLMLLILFFIYVINSFFIYIQVGRRLNTSLRSRNYDSSSDHD